MFFILAPTITPNQNNLGHTALHYICLADNLPMDVFSKLIDIGGRELVLMDFDQFSALSGPFYGKGGHR